jgi:hypothetical protein
VEFLTEENKELRIMVLEMKEDIVNIAGDPEALARLQKQIEKI